MKGRRGEYKIIEVSHILSLLLCRPSGDRSDRGSYVHCLYHCPTGLSITRHPYFIRISRRSRLGESFRPLPHVVDRDGSPHTSTISYLFIIIRYIAARSRNPPSSFDLDRSDRSTSRRFRVDESVIWYSKQQRRSASFHPSSYSSHLIPTIPHPTVTTHTIDCCSTTSSDRDRFYGHDETDQLSANSVTDGS